MGTVKVELDLETAFKRNHVFVVAPMMHPQKGVGFIVCPITQEILSDNFPALYDIIDDAVTFYTMSNQPTNDICEFKWANASHNADRLCREHHCMRLMDGHGNTHSCATCGVIYLGYKDPYEHWKE